MLGVKAAGKAVNGKGRDAGKEGVPEAASSGSSGDASSTKMGGAGQTGASNASNTSNVSNASNASNVSNASSVSVGGKGVTGPVPTPQGGKPVPQVVPHGATVASGAPTSASGQASRGHLQQQGKAGGAKAHSQAHGQGNHHGEHKPHHRPQPGIGMQVPVQYAPTQQFPVNMPQYMQPQYMQTGGGYPGAPYFYPGGFRQQPGNYYVAPMGVSGVAGGVNVGSLPDHSHVGSPGVGMTVGAGGVAKPTPPKVTPPPVREKKILRIEDPNTHVALDLKEISKTTKKEDVEKASSVGDEKESSGSGPASEAKDDAGSSRVSEEQSSVPASDSTVMAAAEAAPVTAEAAPVAAPAEAPPAPPAPPGPNVEEPPMVFAKKEAFRADGTRKMTYSREELLSYKAANTSLPPHIETATLSALFNLKRDDSSGSKDNWNDRSRRNPPPPPRRQNSRQNSRGGPDSDSWDRRRAPPGALRHQSSRDLPALHKSATAYKVGQTTSADPEEELAQKALKALLNKITPDNFLKITEQIVAKINERKKAKTLMGFINQIFDKALAESTFAELYADLVSKLIPALPDLTDDEDNVVNFRRALLNKCQEEFDYGVCAMKAVAEREKHKDEGVTDQDKEDIQREQTARKRMLGNIIFVGQLYRFGVLIEAVMHTCVRQLLEETVDPRPEDIEVLCRLMSTVGRPMDASTREIKGKDGQIIKTSDMMEVYFRRIEMLSSSDKLDMRHRFMLKDLLDLRKSGWKERRKSEGPKKISDIHKDASKDARMKRTDSTMSRSKSGAMRREKSSRNFDRVDAPPRTFSKNRIHDQPNLRPQTSIRRSPSSGAAMNDRFERQERPERQERSERSGASASESGSSEAVKPLSEEELTRKVKTILEELYTNKDESEAVKELKDLSAPGDATIKQAVITSMDMKAFDADLLSKVLIAFDKADAAAYDSAANKILAELADLVVDVPMATKNCGRIFADLVVAGKLNLSSVLKHAATADLEPPPEGEDTMLVDGGDALKLTREILVQVTAAKEDGESVSVTKDTISALIPKMDRSDEAAEALLKEFGL